jgi:hypothetical protein
MNQLTIMRRADGKLFMIKRKGLEYLALWPSLQSALKYKKRNSQLLVFIPSAVASPFGQKSLIPLRKRNTELFLLVDTGDALFGDGHKISWEELETSIPPSSSDWAYQLKPSAANSANANSTLSAQAAKQLDEDEGKSN